MTTPSGRIMPVAAISGKSDFKRAFAMAIAKIRPLLSPAILVLALVRTSVNPILTTPRHHSVRTRAWLTVTT